MKLRLLAILLLFLFVTLSGSAQQEATYTVTFTSNWSQATHPHPSGNLPNGAHWSKLVGAVHNENVNFLAPGELASEGVERIAEQGVNTEFFEEVTTAINQNNALSMIDGDNLNTALGQIVISEISSTKDFPLITLMSMIAPSPDWLIAIHDISLVDENDDWKESISIDLYPYDSGTDSGTDYMSSNNDTNPAEPIANVQGVFPFSNEIIGNIEIELNEIVLDIEDQTALAFSLQPNPASESLSILSSQNITEVSIFNALGVKVLEVNNLNQSEISLDIGQLASGLYLVAATAEDQTDVRRLIVN